MRRTIREFGVCARMGPGGLEYAMAHLGVRRMEASKFTTHVVARGLLDTYPLWGACEDFPELACWMLENGALPTPEQCSECIVALAIGSGRGQSWREELAGRLLQMGGDINAEFRGDSALGVMCGRRGYLRYDRRPHEKGLLQKLLNAPNLQLEVPTREGRIPAERLAREADHDWIAAQISKERTRRGRWGAARRAWVAAVLRARPTTGRH